MKRGARSNELVAKGAFVAASSLKKDTNETLAQDSKSASFRDLTELAVGRPMPTARR